MNLKQQLLKEHSKPQAQYIAAYVSGNPEYFRQLMNILIAVSILSGIYYLIYVASRHQWIGFGDIKLGLVLALLLADWAMSVNGRPSSAAR